jgi:mutator protein MutT
MSASVIQVAAGLVFHGGKLLITQRRLHDHLGGLWEFPGGKLEAGESFAECLVRELREELAIEVRVLQEIEDITHAYPEKTVRLKFFRCELTDGVAKPIHCHALAWISRDELENYEFPAADGKLLEKLRGQAALWEI